MWRHRPSVDDRDDPPGWYAVLPPPGPARVLRGRERADWAVIGAGLTGLAAARRLGELLPDARIALIEGGRVGYGTSGRNSGFVLDAPHYTDHLGLDYNRRLVRLVKAGAAALGRQVREHGIACDWAEIGHVHALPHRNRSDRLDAACRTLDALGDPYERLDGDRLAAILGTAHYTDGIRYPNTILVQPAALVRGLAAALPGNVDLFEDSPVRAVHTGRPATIEGAEGELTAGGVVLATNMFSPMLGRLDGTLFPLLNHASLTRPLDDDEAAAMGGEGEWGLTSASPTGPTMRRTRDRRILVRQTVTYDWDHRLDDARRRRLAAAHRATLLQRYPMLEAVTFEHSWAGFLCMTRNRRAVFGRLEPGLFVSAGYNGVGVARGTISGALLAEYAAGGGSEMIDDALAIAGPTRLPPEPLLGLGVNARIAWMRWRYRRDR